MKYSIERRFDIILSPKNYSVEEAEFLFNCELEYLQKESYISEHQFEDIKTAHQQLSHARKERRLEATLNQQRLIQTKALTPEEKRARTMTIFLILGTLFLGLAGLIFSTAAWELFGVIGRCLILSLNVLFFFGISLFCENKLGLSKTAFTFWVLGLIFTPLIILSLSAFGALGNYFSLDGDGIYLLWSLTGAGMVGLSHLSYRRFGKEGFLKVRHVFELLTQYSLFLFIGFIIGLDDYYLPLVAFGGVLTLFNLETYLLAAPTLASSLQPCLNPIASQWYTKKLSAFLILNTLFLSAYASLGDYVWIALAYLWASLFGHLYYSIVDKVILSNRTWFVIHLLLGFWIVPQSLSDLFNHPHNLTALAHIIGGVLYVMLLLKNHSFSTSSVRPLFYHTLMISSIWLVFVRLISAMEPHLYLHWWLCLGIFLYQPLKQALYDKAISLPTNLCLQLWVFISSLLGLSFIPMELPFVITLSLLISSTIQSLFLLINRDFLSHETKIPLILSMTLLGFSLCAIDFELWVIMILLLAWTILSSIVLHTLWPSSIAFIISLGIILIAPYLSRLTSELIAYLFSLIILILIGYINLIQPNSQLNIKNHSVVKWTSITLSTFLAHSVEFYFFRSEVGFLSLHLILLASFFGIYVWKGEPSKAIYNKTLSLWLFIIALLDFGYRVLLLDENWTPLFIGLVLAAVLITTRLLWKKSGTTRHWIEFAFFIIASFVTLGNSSYLELHGILFTLILLIAGMIFSYLNKHSHYKKLMWFNLIAFLLIQFGEFLSSIDWMFYLILFGFGFVALAMRQEFKSKKDKENKE